MSLYWWQFRKRRKETEQRVEQLMAAARPPRCPHCGEETFYHLCPNFEDRLRAEGKL